MPAKPSVLDEAQKLLRREPLPKDAEAQLDALYKRAPRDEKPLFAELYEALFVAQNA